MKMNDKITEERNELFDSAVREQLAGYEPIVPHALWNRISSELDGGSASGASTPTAHLYEQQAVGNKWKLAIAAAILLTLGAGTLLYTINPFHQANGTVAAVVTKAPVNTKNASQPATIAPVTVTETKMVAQATPPIAKTNVNATTHTATASPVAVKTTETATAATDVKQEQTAQDLQLELAPVSTQNNPVEVGNIPLASLNFLSTPSSLNDEITVIKSTEKKKRHARKAEDEATRVIVLGKKFDTQPDIRYQIPVRF